MVCLFGFKNKHSVTQHREKAKKKKTDEKMLPLYIKMMMIHRQQLRAALVTIIHLHPVFSFLHNPVKT